MKKAAQATPNKQLVSERLKYHWSQREVAAMLGTTRINVSRWECGITVPSPYFRRKLVQLFDKSNEELGLLPSESLASHDHSEPGALERIAAESPVKIPVAASAQLPSDVPSLLLAEGKPIQAPVGDPPAITIASLFHRSTPLRLSPPNAFSLFFLGLSLFALFYSCLVLGLPRVVGAISPKRQQVSQEVVLEKRYFQSLGIGISDGSFIFDTYMGRSDVLLKKEAAAQLMSGNTSRAIDLMTQAVSIDVSDGEIQIYNENLHVLQSGASYITIVLGLAIDGNEKDLIRARSIMQAAFLLQHEVNSKGLLPQGLRLRILIDNSGANNANVAIAAQLIANRVTDGNADHVVGVVGWPFSSQTTNALSSITGVHLPMISQTASSVTLSGIDPYFFRVNPPDSEQGRALGVEAVKHLHAKNILLLSDPTDPYSVSLTNAFYDSISGSGIHVMKGTAANVFSEGKTTVQAYLDEVVPLALKGHIDLIFMAGFDNDVVRLAHAIGLAAAQYPTSRDALENLCILSGDATATSLILGSGGGPDAALARQFPQDMRRLVFSSFAVSGEWSFEHIPPDKQPPFFSDWLSTYFSAKDGSASELAVDDHAILTYDALQVIVRATSLVQGKISGESIRTALRFFGHGRVPAFQGVSGLIAFDDQGNPINKALVILRVKGENNRNNFALQQVIGSLAS